MPVFAAFFVLSVVSSTMGTFLQQGLPYYYQQRGYWPEIDKPQEYDDEQGWRYRQSYQNSYQQDVQYNGYPGYQVSYPFVHQLPRLPQALPQLQQRLPQVTQQLPRVPQRLPQVPQRLPQVTQQLSQQLPQVQQQLSQVPQQLSQVPQQLSQVPQQIPQVPQQLSQIPQQLPQQEPMLYQLLSVGPEVPVLIKLPDQRTTVLPARTVYSLPGFLEGIVQNVQNYYSVFNPLEVLKVQRHNSTILFQAAIGAAPTTTESSETLSTDTAASQAPNKESTGTEAASTEATTTEDAATEAVTTEAPDSEATEGQETTTDSSSSE